MPGPYGVGITRTRRQNNWSSLFSVEALAELFELSESSSEGALGCGFVASEALEFFVILFGPLQDAFIFE